MFLLSPNMNLPIPVVGNEPGPNYAQDVNNALTLLDQHDHSPGKGVLITPNGLNINSTLSFNSNFATNLAGSTYTPQTSTPALDTVYVNGQDLYFVDGLGNNVRITQSGNVAGTPGSISNLLPPASATYVSGSSTFVWQSNVSIAANMDFASAIFRNISPNSTNGVTVQAPASLSSNYTLTLPTIPSSLSFVTVDTSGNLSGSVSLSGGVTGSMIAANTITNSNITNHTLLANSVAPGVQIPIVPQTITTTATVLSGAELILASSSGGSYTITMYSAVAFPGQTAIFKKTTNDTQIITIVPFGGETIDGNGFTTINTLNENLTMISDGANWRIVSRHTATLPVRYTPTLQNAGAGASAVAYTHREGAFLCGQITFTFPLPPAAVFAFSIGFGGVDQPPHVAIDTTAAPVNQNVGYRASENTNNSQGAVIVASSGGGVFLNGGNASAIPSNTNVFGGNGNIDTWFFKVPIQGWNA